MKKEKNNQKFSIKQFMYDKLMYLVALACEVVALLMDKGIIQTSETMVNRVTLAGAIILIIKLVIDGLSSKYRYYSKKWGMGPYADVTGDDSEDIK